MNTAGSAGVPPARNQMNPWAALCVFNPRLPVKEPFARELSLAGGTPALPSKQHKIRK